MLENSRLRVGNGSTKRGDALADKYRDEFERNRQDRRMARAALMSRPDVEEDPDDTQRLKAVLADSKMPERTRQAVGFLAAFPERHRIWAWVVLAVLIAGLIALGGAKALQALGWV